MMRTPIAVHRETLERAIRQAEASGPLRNRNELWIAAASIYNRGCEARGFKAITFSIVLLRAEEWALPIKTPKGKRGRQKGSTAAPRARAASESDHYPELVGGPPTTAASMGAFTRPGAPRKVVKSTVETGESSGRGLEGPPRDSRAGRSDLSTPLPRAALRGGERVYIPSGECPVKLPGEVTPAAIRTWCNDVQLDASKHGEYLAVSGLLYWLRLPWRSDSKGFEYGTAEYEKAKEILQELYPDDQSDEETWK